MVSVLAVQTGHNATAALLQDGKPIVSTPKDAVEETFEPSGLKHLLLGEYLISKNVQNNYLIKKNQ